MKIKIYILLFFSLSYTGIKTYAQTVNTGMLYVSENTKFSSVSSFYNTPEAKFYNDGRSSLYGNLTNEGIFDFYNPTGVLRMVGKQLQTIAGDEIFTTNFHLENLTPFIAFQLKTKVNVYQHVNFNLGILENRVYQGELNFLENAMAFNASSLSFVDGPVHKYGNSDFVYPIGNRNFYRPARTSNLVSTHLIKATYFLSNPGVTYDLQLKDPLIEKIDHQEYWEISIDESQEMLLSLGWDAQTTPSFILNQLNQENAVHIVKWNANAKRWIDIGGAINFSEEAITAAVKESGIYTFALMKFKEINPCDIIVFNAVTPNNDGFNDSLKIENENPDCAQNLVVKIFNRWGVKVFETNSYGDPGQVFDGYSTGRLTVQEQSQLPSGTYYYLLEYNYKKGKGLSKHAKSGYIHLSVE
ncbi:gliding motility-associated C-terminal domain-containing protein [Mesonia aestuariivivens]|uniref:Gliding motility-associated C-terminal domain-containing protein n=1 Tax=Mesonia aestuariivivens TaxID=2796128 RepID=A0ABS6W3E7_9FLAO|nr:gliding motility-associated C-terminal domain-containing protein [Mesonia aestuariivivens]MBW2962380.1 gliding motility-associated C-terminal domain-containing protein [Mesonia aestuariivivens]